jgi:hypothetical protein
MNRSMHGLVVVSTLAWIGVTAIAQNGPTLDDSARLLAGLPVTGPLASFVQTSGWQANAAAMDKTWKTKEYFQLGPIATWMNSHAPEYYHSTGAMYHMFSGPDFFTRTRSFRTRALTFWPASNRSGRAGPFANESRGTEREFERVT